MVKMHLPLDKQVLRGFFTYAKGSINARTSIGGIIKFIPRILKNNQKPIKKSVRRLVALGYLIEHPSGRNITYELSKLGKNYILSL